MIGKDKLSNGNALPFADVIAISSFRYLWFGQIASQLASNTLIFVLALRVYHTTASNTAVSLLFLVYGTAAVLFGMAGGTIVDKFDKRLVLVVCDLVRAVGVFGFLLFPRNIAAIYILTFVNAMVTQLYVPAEAPTIPRLVPSGLLIPANSLFSFTYFTSLAIGSIFAGPFLRVFGPTGIFLFLSFLFFVAAGSVSRVPSEERANPTLARIRGMKLNYIIHRVIANAQAGLEYVTRSKALREALTLLVGTQVILAILGTLGPGFADKMLNIDIRDASLIVTGPVVIGIISGALWVGSAGINYDPEWLISRGIFSAGVILVVVSILVRLKSVPLFSSLFPNSILMPLVLLLFFLLGVANSFLDVPANSILQKKAEGDMRGRVYGMLAAAVGGVGILPVIIGGILADVAGVGSVIFFMGLLICCLGWVRVRYNKKTQ